jgi:hypothetical protein
MLTPQPSVSTLLACSLVGYYTRYDRQPTDNHSDQIAFTEDRDNTTFHPLQESLSWCAMTPAQEITPLVLCTLILRWRRQYWLSIYSDLGACFLCLVLHLAKLPELSLGMAVAYVAGAFWTS